MARAKLLVVVLAAGLGGCPVDDRTLLEESESQGGSSGSRAGRAGRGASNSGGDEDAGAFDPCDYVSGEQPDAACATLVQNPGFHQDINAWQSEKSAIYIGWNGQDATRHSNSGSISVLSLLSGPSPIGVVSEGARQCLEALAGAKYIAAVNVFIPSLQEFGWDGGFESAEAGINILFYEKDNCEGASIPKGFSATLGHGVDSWTSSVGVTTAPDGTRSMAVRLIVIKPISQPSLSALFDNVLVQER